MAMQLIVKYYQISVGEPREDELGNPL